MRVVLGKCKGYLFKVVFGNIICLMIDKVKEFIFNMIGFYFDGGIVFDLFGGSGGFGIEVLSRGIDKVIFVDWDSKVIKVIY